MTTSSQEATFTPVNVASHCFPTGRNCLVAALRIRRSGKLPRFACRPYKFCSKLARQLNDPHPNCIKQAPTSHAPKSRGRHIFIKVFCRAQAPKPEPNHEAIGAPAMTQVRKYSPNLQRYMPYSGDS